MNWLAIGQLLRSLSGAKVIVGAVALVLTATILVVSDERVTPWTLLDVLRDYESVLDQQ